MRCIFLSLVFVSVLVRETFPQGSSSWSCHPFTPNLSIFRGKEASPAASSPYRLTVSPEQVQSGQDVIVTLLVEPPSSGEITGFIIQARNINTKEIQGIWSIPSDNLHAKTRQCGETPDDTATNKQLHSVQVLTLTWKAPQVTEGLTVELVGAAMDGSAQQYWTLEGNNAMKIEVTTVTVVREPEEGVEEPAGNTGGDEITDTDIDPQVTTLDAEDEHDLLLETKMERDFLEKKMADIAMENLASETDSTLEDQKKREEDEYKWEMEDFEKTQYEENMRRQERIDRELRDKEEWEANQAAEEEKRKAEEEKRRQERLEKFGDGLEEVDVNKIDTDPPTKKTSDGCRQTSTFALYTTFFFTVLACLL